MGISIHKYIKSQLWNFYKTPLKINIIRQFIKFLYFRVLPTALHYDIVAGSVLLLIMQPNQRETFWIYYLLLSVWRSTSYKPSKGHQSNCPFVLGCTLTAHHSIRRRLSDIFNVHSMKAYTTGADKSLARTTSRCRRMESLERGVCSCAEMQVFSYYRGRKEACQETRALSTTWRRELSSSYFSLQGKATKEIHAILIEPLEENAPSYTSVKNKVVQFKRGDFSTCDSIVLQGPMHWPPRRLLIKFNS